MSVSGHPKGMPQSTTIRITPSAADERYSTLVTRPNRPVLSTLSTAILFISCAASAEPARAIRNEAIRQAALQSIFPGMKIKVLPGK